MPERQTAADIAGIRRDHVERYELAARLIAERGLARAADVACGCGYGARLLAGAGAAVGAVDRDPAAIDHAVHHFAHPAITWITGDAETIRLAPAEIVVSFETVEHLADPGAALALFRDAAPLLLISVPNQERNPFDAATHRWHRRHYTPAQLDALLGGAGYAVRQSWSQTGKAGGLGTAADGWTLIRLAERTP